MSDEVLSVYLLLSLPHWPPFAPESVLEGRRNGMLGASSLSSCWEDAIACRSSSGLVATKPGLLRLATVLREDLRVGSRGPVEAMLGYFRKRSSAGLTMLFSEGLRIGIAGMALLDASSCGLAWLLLLLLLETTELSEGMRQGILGGMLDAGLTPRKGVCF